MPPFPEVTVEMFRTNKVEGKEVTEFGVFVHGGKRDDCLSWHRYTDFRVLHDKIFRSLGMDPRFPCPKALIFTDEHKTGRAAELQQYLQSCVCAAEESLPAALELFLFTPTSMSTVGRSQSFADASSYLSGADWDDKPPLEPVPEDGKPKTPEDKPPLEPVPEDGKPETPEDKAPLEAAPEDGKPKPSTARQLSMTDSLAIEAAVAGKVAEWHPAWVEAAVVASQEQAIGEAVAESAAAAVSGVVASAETKTLWLPSGPCRAPAPAAPHERAAPAPPAPPAPSAPAAPRAETPQGPEAASTLQAAAEIAAPEAVLRGSNKEAVPDAEGAAVAETLAQWWPALVTAAVPPPRAAPRSWFARCCVPLAGMLAAAQQSAQEQAQAKAKAHALNGSGSALVASAH